MKYHRSPDFERVTILLPVSEARLLKHLAVDIGQTASAVVRAAVKDLLAREEPTSGSEDRAQAKL